MADSLIDKARQAWTAIQSERNKKANTAGRVGSAGIALCDAFANASPYIGANGNWWIGGSDTGKPSVGTSTPVNCYFTKSGVNGEIFPTPFRWTENLKASSVLLMSDCAGFTCEIDGAQYTQDTLAGTELPAGGELKLLDLEIKAGSNTGNVLILFEKI